MFHFFLSTLFIWTFPSPPHLFSESVIARPQLLQHCPCPQAPSSLFSDHSSASPGPQFFHEAPGELYLLHSNHSLSEPNHLCLPYGKIKSVGHLADTTLLLAAQWRLSCTSFYLWDTKLQHQYLIKHYLPARFPWLTHLKPPIPLYHSTVSLATASTALRVDVCLLHQSASPWGWDFSYSFINGRQMSSTVSHKTKYLMYVLNKSMKLGILMWFSTVSGAMGKKGNRGGLPLRNWQFNSNKFYSRNLELYGTHHLFGK